MHSSRICIMAKKIVMKIVYEQVMQFCKGRVIYLPDSLNLRVSVKCSFFDEIELVFSNVQNLQAWQVGEVIL